MFLIYKVGLAEPEIDKDLQEKISIIRQMHDHEGKTFEPSPPNSVSQNRRSDLIVSGVDLLYY
jgi:hypothetical protein